MKPYCTHVGVLEFYWVVSLSCISYYFVGKGLMNDDLRFLDNGELQFAFIGFFFFWVYSEDLVGIDVFLILWNNN